jgi:hypothetical protein
MIKFVIVGTHWATRPFRNINDMLNIICVILMFIYRLYVCIVHTGVVALSPFLLLQTWGKFISSVLYAHTFVYIAGNVLLE